MNDTAGDLMSDDLLEASELFPLSEGHDDFGTFLELLDPEFSPDPACSGASCVTPPDEGDQRSEGPVPPLPTQQSPIPDHQFTTEVPEDPEAARLERIRAKNRRGQAKYREKLKVLPHGLTAKPPPLQGSCSSAQQLAIASQSMILHAA